MVLEVSCSQDEIAETYWQYLNPDNWVALAVKMTNHDKDMVNVRTINALGNH